jgi:hypothetical protein
LQAIGFKGSQANHSLYVYQHGSILLYFLIYVDDIILAGADLNFINHVISLLQSDFPIKNLSELSFFLGVEAIQSDEGLYLSQRCYILDLLLRSKMDKSRPSVTPMSISPILNKSDGAPFHDPHLYRSIVGGL